MSLLDRITAYQRRRWAAAMDCTDAQQRAAAEARADAREQLLKRLVPKLRREREANHFGPRIREALREEEW